MATIVYDLFLVVMGLILGVIVSEPLKKIFTGKYKEEARQRKRVKLLLVIRQNKSKQGLTTEELAEKVFKGKLALSTVYMLLTEIEEIGLVKGIGKKDHDMGKVKWIYSGK